MSSLWLEVATGILASLPGVAFSRWLGFRDGKKAAKEEAAKAIGVGPYRAAAAPAAEEPHPKESSWLCPPQQACPRCGDNDIRLRGRFQGDHQYLNDASAMAASQNKCKPPTNEPHIHYQCYECGADWIELPPERYVNG